MTRLFPIAVLLVAASAARAQAPAFAVEGQVRHRSESDARDLSGTSDPVLFHLLRTRLGVGVRPQPHVRAFVQVQDARLFGGEDPALGHGTLDGSADGLDLHQAYLAVDSLFGSGVGLTLGRQELAYGNERLVGAVGWGNVGRAFDAVAVRLRRGRVAADVFAAELVSPVGRGGAERLVGLYATAALGAGHALDAFAFYDGDAERLAAGLDAGARRLARVTPGLRAHGTSGRFDYDVEAVVQRGRLASGDSAARRPARASLVSAAAGWTAGPARSLRLGAGYTRLSGDGDPSDGTAGTFHTLFATNHKFYGFMDYLPGLLTDRGLQDGWGSVGVAVGGLLLSADLHHFAAAAGPPGVPGTFGQEADLTAVYRHSPALVVTAGASAFRPGAAVRTPQGGRTSHWLYLQTQVTF